MPLDEFLPAYDANELHAIRVDAPPARALAAVRELTAREVPLLVALMAVRSVPAIVLRRRSLSPAGRIVEQFLNAGFVVLAERPDELIVGGVGRFWKPAGGIRPVSAAEFATFAEPGYARAAIEFRALEAPDGATLLSTETRIQATDGAARHSFGRYWRVIGPGSAAIRRSWLRAVRRRAKDG